MKKLSLLAVFLFASFSLTFAQEKGEKLPYNRWEIGVNAGVSNFTGSYVVSKSEFLKYFNNFNSDYNFGYGVLVKKNFTHVFALEGAYNATTLTGTPVTIYNAFKTGISEFDLNTVWNMSNLLSKNKVDRKFYWYTKLGTGLTHVNNKNFTDATVQGPWRYWTIPVGAGLVFRLSDNVRLDLGTQWSWVNTNRLDGVNQGGLGQKFLIGAVRENYLYSHAGLSFMLGKKPVKPAPVVEAPKPQPKPEPKPEPKPVPPAPPKHVTPACVGEIFKVYFAFDKWDLNPTSKAELDRLAKDMQENPSVDLEMKSHTDSRGPASYNMKLSEKRGKSVLEYLAAKGISASRVNAQAFGETQLVNKCKDGVKCNEAEHALNRRTETLVIE
ncbi:MAG: OmpA family protein [Prolixibacteraceae bacterium]|jgi:outer membrane protein OmpA-like peptidoglycan-associated protein|nr:OmpA family protein [Prolixibacteraceae bacterium]